MKKINQQSIITLIALVFLSSSLVQAMISVGHFKTDQAQQVLLFGESQHIDVDLQRPGYSAALMNPVLDILRTLTFKQRIAVLIEMESNYFVTENETSHLSPLSSSLTTLYRGMLEKGRSPWMLTLEDKRGAESDYMIGVLDTIETKVQQHLPADSIISYVKNPGNFKDKPNSGAACEADIGKTMINSRKPVTLRAFLASLEDQNEYIRKLSKKWADQPLFAAFLLKACRSHGKAKDGFVKIFEKTDPEVDLWIAVRGLFANKKMSSEILETTCQLIKLHRKTDFQFCAICLLDRLFDFLREGQTMAVIFAGHVHTDYLAKVFKTALQWETVNHVSCLTYGRAILKEYAIPAGYKDTLTKITKDCMDSHEVTMLNNVSIFQCFHCLNLSDTRLALCATCEHAQYCSKECQRKAWPEHKKVCKAKIV